jgi:hypothetical protein
MPTTTMPTAIDLTEVVRWAGNFAPHNVCSLGLFTSPPPHAAPRRPERRRLHARLPQQAHAGGAAADGALCAGVGGARARRLVGRLFWLHGAGHRFTPQPPGKTAAQSRPNEPPPHTHTSQLRYFVLAGSVLRYYKSERDVGLNPRGAVDVQVGALARFRRGGVQMGSRWRHASVPDLRLMSRSCISSHNPPPSAHKQSCFVELEVEGESTEGASGGFLLWNRGRRGVWRFRIVEPGGHLLLWLSTDSRASAEQWVAALDAAGLIVLAPGEKAPAPPPSPAGRGGGSTSAASPGSTGGSAVSRRARQRQQQQQHEWEACSTDSELPEPPAGRPGGGGSTGGGGMSGGGAQHARAPRAPLGRPPLAPGAGDGASFLDAAAPAAATARVANAATAAAADAGDADVAATPPRRAAGRESSGAPGGRKSAADAKPTRPPMSGSTPVHTITRYSFLSSDSVWAARHDGLLNLALIILVVSNLRWVDSLSYLAHNTPTRGNVDSDANHHYTSLSHPPSHPKNRLILENLLKYGIRLNLVAYIANGLRRRGDDGRTNERRFVLLCFPGLLLFAMMGLVIELLGLALLRWEGKVRKRTRVYVCSCV